MRAQLHPYFGHLPDALPPGALLAMSEVMCVLRLRPEELDAAMDAGAAPSPSICRPGFRRWTAAAVHEALRARQDSVGGTSSEA